MSLSPGAGGADPQAAKRDQGGEGPSTSSGAGGGGEGEGRGEEERITDLRFTIPIAIGTIDDLQLTIMGISEGWMMDNVKFMKGLPDGYFEAPRPPRGEE